MAHLQHMGQLSPLLGGAQALPGGGAIPAGNYSNSFIESLF